MKVVRFAWKFAHMVSWKCWFRIRTYIFENLTPKCINFVDIKFKIFWANFGEKSQYCLFCLTIGTHGIFGRVDTKSEVRFSKCRPRKSISEQVWAKKAFPVYSHLRSYFCFGAYINFWFYILQLLYILLLHFISGCISMKCLYFYFIVNIYCYSTCTI